MIELGFIHGRFQLFHNDHLRYALLAKEVDTDDKKTVGTADKYDLFYYVYYCTATVPVTGGAEGETKTVLQNPEVIKAYIGG